MPLFNFVEEPGNYYAYLIEGHGDDANDGLTPEMAVATLNRVVTVLNNYAGTSRRNAIIYNRRISGQAVIVARTNGKPISFIFIGGTIMRREDGLTMYPQINSDSWHNVDSDYSFVSASSSAVSSFYNCIIRGFSSEYLTISPSGLALAGGGLFYNCVIDSFRFYFRLPTSTTFDNCVLINVSDGSISIAGNYNIARIKNCIIINSEGFRVWEAIDMQFDYNCIPGKILYRKSDGSQLLVTQEELVVLPKNYNSKGIAANPQFNDDINYNYTMRSSSPCLYRGDGGQHIGLGEAFYLTPSELYNNAEVVLNFQVQSKKLLRINDVNDALLETFILDIGGVRQINTLDLVVSLGFVGSEIQKSLTRFTKGYIAYDALVNYHTGSTITDSAIKYLSLVDNNLGNTPASSPVSWERMTWQSGVSFAAGKIVQYTDDKWYKANTITSTSWVAGEWDEIVPIETLNFALKYGRTFAECQAASWKYFNFNELLLEDSAGKGVADNDYDILTASSIRFNYFKLLIHAKTIK